MQALEEAIQGRTVAFYDQLVADMTVANLLEVPAGAPYLHLSSAVLLRGSLRVQGQALDASAPRSSSGEPAAWPARCRLELSGTRIPLPHRCCWSMQAGPRARYVARRSWSHRSRLVRLEKDSRRNQAALTS